LSAKSAISLKQCLVADIRNRILSGGYKPGEHLPEAKICRRFKVSRTPVRDALNQLETEGLVTITPNKGARVITLSYDDVSNIYDMLIILEGAASRFACLKANADVIAKLEEYEFLLEKATSESNLDLVFQLNIKFHWLITESTGNPYLIETQKNYRRLVERFARFSPFISDQLKATIEDHPKIIIAFKKRNPALAEFVAKEHMENAKKFMLAYLKEL
jgi:DNA-binding GntR family transcriptional regulator